MSNNFQSSFPYLKELFNSSKLHDPIKELKEKEKLIPAFVYLKSLVKHHLDSFNHFLNIDLKNIIKAKSNNRVVSDIDPTFYLQYNAIRVGLPSIEENFDSIKLTPHQCRISDWTYAANIFVDVEFFIKDIKIGRMPIMVGSTNCHLFGKNEKELADLQECPYDPKGYFIVKGVEKVALVQEQMAKNRIIIERDSKSDTIMANVASSTLDTKTRMEIRIKGGKLYVKAQSFTEIIPIFIIFKAMGIESEQQIFELIGLEKYIIETLSLSLEDCAKYSIYTQQQALEFLSQKIRVSKFADRKTTKTPLEDARDCLTNILLAHIPCKKFDFFGKALYLGLMIRRLLEALQDHSKIDDKDYYGNKRLECAGQLLALLFEDKFKVFNSELKKRIDKYLSRNKDKDNLAYIDMTQHMKGSEIITNGFFNAISSGNWSIKRFKMERAGVTQVLSRLTYIAALGMMTRINSQFEKTRKISGPRALQGSHWGIICPSDTPDGESCGLVKNLALLTYITNDQPERRILKLTLYLGLEDLATLSGKQLQEKYLVFLNGLIIGVINNPLDFVFQLRKLRRKGIVNEFVSVSIAKGKKAVNIACDYGRIVRPLIIVEGGKTLLGEKDIDLIKKGEKSFDELVKEGKIEYLDVNEEDNSLIAINVHEINKSTTHLEIDPYTILGCVAGLIPYPHHNQSPRNTYQCAMGKQAVGSVGYNQHLRVDKVLHLMVYPQKPLVVTKTIELTHYDKLPAGHNAIVAVMSYSGYDIEDAVILNKASLDRGFGRSVTYKRNSCELFKHAEGVHDIIVPPEEKTEENKKFLKRQRALDKDGVVKTGEILNAGDIYVNKYSPNITQEQIKEMSKTLNTDPKFQQWKNTSVCYKDSKSVAVDRVILTVPENPEIPLLVKTIFRQVRRPEIGDKMSSRHGQKGVCGLIVEQVDMPFTEQGVCPDLIMNPHGFPSRMTVGKMIELIAGKAASMDAFAGDKLEELAKSLIKAGLTYSGKEAFISGITGEYLQCYVFAGPTFYQRLRHMVADKIQARARGPMTTLTRQPTQGRARDGGMRLGEMERDCLIGYGATSLLFERLVLSSDQFSVFVCRKCGMMKHEQFCKVCESNDVHMVKIPYACKLLFQELLAMNIKPKILLK